MIMMASSTVNWKRTISFQKLGRNLSCTRFNRFNMPWCKFTTFFVCPITKVMTAQNEKLCWISPLPLGSRHPPPRSRYPLGQGPPSGAGTPPRQGISPLGAGTPPGEGSPLPGAGTRPTPSRRLLLRTVRILLECICFVNVTNL